MHGWTVRPPDTLTVNLQTPLLLTDCFYLGLVSNWFPTAQNLNPGLRNLGNSVLFLFNEWWNDVLRMTLVMTCVYCFIVGILLCFVSSLCIPPLISVVAKQRNTFWVNWTSVLECLYSVFITSNWVSIFIPTAFNWLWLKADLAKVSVIGHSIKETSTLKCLLMQSIDLTFLLYGGAT